VSISELVNKGWGAHPDDPEGVLASMEAAVDDVSDPADALRVAGLGSHCAGEHLGQWQRGLDLLGRLSDTVDPDHEAAGSLWRTAAVLTLCAGGDWEPLLARGPTEPAESGRVRVLAGAAGALVGQGQSGRAGELLTAALAVAAYGPAKDDPAARSLAITGNNLACELEVRGDRSAADDALLEQAALLARQYWEVAGTWTNVKIAEYRLAMTYLALGRPADARAHANAGLEIWKANQGGPADAVFVRESLAKVAHALGEPDEARRQYELALEYVQSVEDQGFKGYCEGEIAKLGALLAG
jgi:tetratricopeptide (TPR) repeat protein